MKEERVLTPGGLEADSLATDSASARYAFDGIRGGGGGGGKGEVDGGAVDDGSALLAFFLKSSILSLNASLSSSASFRPTLNRR